MLLLESPPGKCQLCPLLGQRQALLGGALLLLLQPNWAVATRRGEPLPVAVVVVAVGVVVVVVVVLLVVVVVLAAVSGMMLVMNWPWLVAISRPAAPKNTATPIALTDFALFFVLADALGPRHLPLTTTVRIAWGRALA